MLIKNLLDKDMVPGNNYDWLQFYQQELTDYVPGNKIIPNDEVDEENLITDIEDEN